MALPRHGSERIDATGHDSAGRRPRAGIRPGRPAYPVHRSPGRSVYHCHILDHEDLGMMGTVNVRDH
ncbi:multicopper oxidase domain-containing protein [Catellatospora coxensis]